MREPRLELEWVVVEPMAVVLELLEVAVSIIVTVAGPEEVLVVAVEVEFEVDLVELVELVELEELEAELEELDVLDDDVELVEDVLDVVLEVDVEVVTVVVEVVDVVVVAAVYENLVV